MSVFSCIYALTLRVRGCIIVTEKCNRGEQMANPWEEISLDDYENHMSLDSVGQLQALNALMRLQFSAHSAKTVMVLGVAGGNGLEHARPLGFEKIYGVDISDDYLREVSRRFADMSGVLECLRIDLLSDAQNLPQAQLVIADLLIEYIGYKAFQRAVEQIKPEYVSCVIQVNTDPKAWVSDSPYLHAFDRLDEVHHQMCESELEQAMAQIGFAKVLRSQTALPNGKALVRLDFLCKNLTNKRL